MSYDDMRRNLNADLRLSYEKYLTEQDKDTVKRKQEEELYCQARLRQINAEKMIHENKLAKENELFENAERLIAEQMRRPTVVALGSEKYEMSELHALCKTMRSDIELLKAEVAALKIDYSGSRITN
jgi:hypothetical protein